MGMRQSVWMVLCAVSIYAILASHRAQAVETGSNKNQDFFKCEEIADKDKTAWNKKLGGNIATHLMDKLRPLHSELSQSDAKSRERATAAMKNAFDTKMWSKRLGEVPAEVQEQFTSWVVLRYFGVLNQTAFSEERRQLRLGRLDDKTRARISQFPAEPRITRITDFVCKDSDSTPYDCASKYIQIDVQLSPSLFCKGPEGTSDHALSYILVLRSQGPLVVDVVRADSPLFAQSLKEYKDLAKDADGNALLNSLRQLSLAPSR